MSNEPQKSNPLKNTTSNKPKFNFYWVYGILAALILGMQFFNSKPEPIEVFSWPQVEKMIKANDVLKIIIVNSKYAEIYIQDSAKKKYPESKKLDKDARLIYNYKFGTIENFEKRLEPYQNNVSLVFEERKDWGGEILGWVLPILLIVGFWIFMMRRMGGGGGPGQIFSIGKSKAQVYDKETSVQVNFNDVAGLQEAKVELNEIVDFLKNPKKYTELGGKIPKGALLVGPPGTGKTLLAKAIAGEAKVPFFSLTGSDFVEMFVGVGASRVRDLFKQAKDKAPCIVFIDEIDAIGRARGKSNMTGGNDERENTLNQLLSEMDGFASNTGIIILAATNRAEILDRALMRAGRFDRQIHVELPDLDERKAIFTVHMRNLKLSGNAEAGFLAKQTPGFSGADIANVCNESALIAARHDKKAIEKQDFLDAIDRIVGGLEKRNKIISKDEKKVVAYHESGHASVSWLLEHAHPLIKVTIIPRGKALGAAWYLPEERQITTFEQMFDEMTSVMGGRAAEEVFFGKVSTGALNDLEKATKQAYAIVAYFGLNKRLGNISYYDSSGQSEYSLTKPFSEKTSEIIDEEVHKILEEAYNRARTTILDNKDKVEQLSTILLEREVIFREDLEAVFGKRPFAEPEEEEVRQAEAVIEPQENNSTETSSTAETPQQA